MIETRIKNLPWRFMDDNLVVFWFTVFSGVRCSLVMDCLIFRCGWIG
jgi:hypothetical protein